MVYFVCIFFVLGYDLLNRAGGEAVEAVVVVLRADATTAEVQEPTERGGVERRRPVEAPLPRTEEAGPFPVSCGGKKDAVAVLASN